MILRLRLYSLGSGGGGGHINGGRAGAGGGAVKISAAGTVTVTGSITMNGGDGVGESVTYDSGGGSGGSIFIEADTLAGSGIIEANGGSGGLDNGGGGGGGRISILYQTANNWSGNSLTPSVATTGGSGGATGSDGTVYLTLAARYTITGTTGVAITDPSTGDDALSGGVLSNANIDLRVTEGGGVVADSTNNSNVKSKLDWNISRYRCQY